MKNSWTSELVEFVEQNMELIESVDPLKPGGLARRVEQMLADGRFVDRGDGPIKWSYLPYGDSRGVVIR